MSCFFFPTAAAGLGNGLVQDFQRFHVADMAFLSIGCTNILSNGTRIPAWRPSAAANARQPTVRVPILLAACMLPSTAGFAADVHAYLRLRQMDEPQCYPDLMLHDLLALIRSFLKAHRLCMRSNLVGMPL